MTGVLIKRGNWEIDVHTGRMPCEDEGRGRGDTSSSQRMAKLDSKPPEARREAWTRFSSTALRGKQLCQLLDLGLLAPRTVRRYISVI